MGNRQVGRTEDEGHDYLQMVKYEVSSMRDEMRDRSMKDQKLYLISKQEQRVGFHLLTAIKLSERLEEFVTCMMKLRGTLRTSLLLLLELKAYPVNCSTHILQVVVRFCNAKLCLDGVRLRDKSFMNTSEERSYWITFLWRDLDASETLLQVGKDLGIKSLIQVVHLVHQPSSTAFLRPPSERRLLLSSSSLSSSLAAAKARASGRHQTGGLGSPFTYQPQCFSGFKLADISSLLLRNFTSKDSADVAMRNWGLPESPNPVLLSLVADGCEDENSTSSKSREHVMSLSELMRLETVVETINKADDLQDVVSELSKKFDACLVSESGSKPAQIIKAHRLNKSWSYTAFSKRSPVKGTKRTSVKRGARFQISPEVDDVIEEESEITMKDSVSTMDHSNSWTGKAEELEGTSTCTAEANNVSVAMKSGKKQKLLSGLKAAAKTLWTGNKGKNSGRTKSAKRTMSSPNLSR